MSGNETGALEMIDYVTAFDLVLRRVKPLDVAEFPLRECNGMTLGRDLRAAAPIPHFDSSSVDGYGIGHADAAAMKGSVEKSFTLRGAIRAGDAGKIRLVPGSACLINTGAPVPGSVAAVIMKEKGRLVGKQLLLTGPVKPGQHIRRAGGEFRTGALLAAKGETLTPPAVGLLATAGHARIPAIRRPKIGILVTGNELRLPSASVRAGQVRDSLSFILDAAARGLDCDRVALKFAPDNPAAIRSAMRALLASSDLLLTTGGVSVGDRDYVKEAFASLGVREVFWRVAIKPGKPLWFGLRGAAPVFGLPGNPVSAAICFQLFARPAILRLMGRLDARPVTVTAFLASEIRKEPGRLEFVRAQIAKGRDGSLHAFPLPGQESHMLGGLARADGLILFPREKKRMRKGEMARVQLLDWGMM